MPKGSFDLKAWARIGAERRLTEIREEIDRIRAIFPDVRLGGESASPRRRRGRKAVSSSVAQPAKRRRRRKLSAEARERIAAAQRKRWAKIKRAKG